MGIVGLDYSWWCCFNLSDGWCKRPVTAIDEIDAVTAVITLVTKRFCFLAMVVMFYSDSVMFPGLYLVVRRSLMRCRMDLMFHRNVV